MAANNTQNPVIGYPFALFWDATGGSTFVELGYVTSADVPELTVNPVERKLLSLPLVQRIPGYASYGKCVFKLEYSYVAFLALGTVAAARSIAAFKLQFNGVSGETLTFTGFITSHKVETIEGESIKMINLEVQPSGTYTYATGA